MCDNANWVLEFKRRFFRNILIFLCSDRQLSEKSFFVSEGKIERERKKIVKKKKKIIFRHWSEREKIEKNYIFTNSCKTRNLFTFLHEHGPHWHAMCSSSNYLSIKWSIKDFFHLHLVNFFPTGRVIDMKMDLLIFSLWSFKMTNFVIEFWLQFAFIYKAEGKIDKCFRVYYLITTSTQIAIN